MYTAIYLNFSTNDTEFDIAQLNRLYTINLTANHRDNFTY